ncbi:hypothetical protein NCS52_01092100 [Fusarium sp. LHS14.1]|nr:hypothetical protein NCS52_01092100 [Fusarium sp. LHS14.1]
MIQFFHRLQTYLGGGIGPLGTASMRQAITDIRPPLVRLGDVSYLAIPHVGLELQSCGPKALPCAAPDLLPGEHKPVIVVSVDQESSQKTLLDWIDSFHPPKDDVFSQSFLTDTVIVQGNAQDFQRVRDAWLTLSPNPVTGSWAPSQVLLVESPERDIPNGPYFLGPGLQLYQAWRLYPDTQGSFVTSLFPSLRGAHEFYPLDVRLGGIWPAVAVPSRLYSKRTPSKPLAGLRFSIKDNFRLSGIMTTQSNRAWCELYNGKPENETAAYVKTLIDLGAVFVGKTIMCSFASSEEATDQWIDFHAPFNPRGDGYQSPSGSTTGGATGLAAYDWLDYSIGTDTTGSIRWPAAWCGLFGLRMTWKQGSLDGVYAACRFMDTIGLLSRSIDGMQALAKGTISSVGAKDDEKPLPTEILYPQDFFPMANSEQQVLVDRFVGDLEAYLGIKATKMSIAERWRQCPPDEADGKTIEEFLEKVAYNPFYYDGYHEFDDFRKEYEDKFGKPVYVGPYMRWKWDRGSEVTEAMKAKSLDDVGVYRRWFQANILRATQGGGTSAIMLIPCGNSVPKYRDDPNNSPGPVGAFTWNYIASVQGLPQLVSPIGHIPYESRVSRRVEQLPVVGTIIGAPGSDLLLVDVVKNALERAGRPTRVLTGRNMFPDPKL